MGIHRSVRDIMGVHPPQLEAILQELGRYHAEILHLCGDAPLAAVIKPSLPGGWSVKDVLAHLAAWEWRCVSLLVAAYDTDWPLKARPDIEGLTREFYQERKEWSWTEAETDFRRAHRALIQTIEQLPPNRKENLLVQQTIVKEALKHYLRHLPALKRWHEEMIAPLIK